MNSDIVKPMPPSHAHPCNAVQLTPSEWRRENGPVTLRLTGRNGVKQFIETELPKTRR